MTTKEQPPSLSAYGKGDVNLEPSVDEIVRDEAIRRRVAKLLEKEIEKPRSFLDKWADSSIGKFVLTGIVGAALTVGFQIIADHYKRDAERRDSRRVEALLLVDSLGGLLERWRPSDTAGSSMPATAWDLKSDSARRADSAFAAFNERLERREGAFAAKSLRVRRTARLPRGSGSLRTPFAERTQFLARLPVARGGPTFDEVDSALSVLRDSVFQFSAELARILRLPRPVRSILRTDAVRSRLARWYLGAAFPALRLTQIRAELVEDFVSVRSQPQPPILSAGRGEYEEFGDTATHIYCPGPEAISIS